jgi:hypothetical protein
MISIIVPSIRPSLQRLIDSIDCSLREEYELIVIGPENHIRSTSDLAKRVKFISDRGSPSRCLQRGISEASGDIFTWATDDGIYNDQKLAQCVNTLRGKSQKSGIIIKYTEEGPRSDFNGSLDEYYIIGNHADGRHPGVDNSWKIAPLGMYYRDYFVSIGGFDCRYDHINMNTHDFAFRLQRDGGSFFYSDGVVIHCDSNSNLEDHKVLDVAYTSHDLPLFRDMYKNKDRPIIIDFDNWKDQPEVWRRFA